jgi:hypothetical protein
MDLHEITSLLTQTAKAISANEKVALPIVAAKARREAQAHPTDVPLVNASHVLTKMASDQTFISKDELRGIIERFSASHSKLSQVFSEELGKQPEHKPHTFSRDSNEGMSVDRDYARFADPLLSNALAGAFAPEPTEKLYSQQDAQRAKRAAHAQLVGIGVQPKDIKTFAGRKDIIICQAIHETPLGQANILIPVELKEGKAVLPTMFFSTAGFEDLKKGPYVAQMKIVAGKTFRVDGAKLLDVLEQVKKGSDSIADEVEMAAIKVASEQGTPAMHSDSIMYAELEKTKKDVDTNILKVASTEESKFAETLGKPDGVARFVHGDRIVEAGRSMLVRKFADMGYKSVQVRVGDVEEDKIFYSVAVGTGTGLSVPVEVVGQMVAPPKIVFADGMVTAFSKEAISEVIKAGSGGNKRALATASPCYGMKPTELLDVVKESVAEGNFIRAEDAINVLGEVDPHAQRVAIAHMMSNIYEPGREPKKEIVEMQRIANQPVTDTPQFMTHKIFFPEGA